MTGPTAAAPAAAPSRAATTLRAATDADVARILAWRNHPAVRRVMFTDHQIQPDEHVRWWTRVSRSVDHVVLILQHAGRDCGVVTFTRDDDEAAGGDPHGDTWSWGFYIDPDAFPAGAEQLRAWSGMEQASLAHARDALQARRIHCEVFAFNGAVLALHKRHGFVERDRYWRSRSDGHFEVVRLGRDTG